MIADLDAAIDRVRHFNRYYTRQIGVLNEALLASAYSLTEARILFEVAEQATTTAGTLVRELGLDPGYLSRILRKLEDGGLVERTTSERDRRQSLLGLTEAGRTAMASLQAASQDDVRRLLSPLNPVERDRLLTAMATVESVLSPDRSAHPPFVLRQHRPGDMGWVVHRHAVLYAQEHGWDASFESFVARIAADFVDRHDPAAERCWIAERDGAIVGSVFVVRDTAETAKLRLLYVEPDARGLGLGNALVGECLRFARSAGYRRITLWTNDILQAARHLYGKAGFRLVREEPHHSFGQDLVGQYWERDL